MSAKAARRSIHGPSDGRFVNPLFQYQAVIGNLLYIGVDPDTKDRRMDARCFAMDMTEETRCLERLLETLIRPGPKTGGLTGPRAKKAPGAYRPSTTRGMRPLTLGVQWQK